MDSSPIAHESGVWDNLQIMSESVTPGTLSRADSSGGSPVSASENTIGRGRIAWIGGVLLLVAFGLSLSAHQYQRFPGDLPVTEGIQSISVPVFSDAMEVVSELGDWALAVPATAVAVVALWLYKRRPDALYIVVITLASAGLNRLVKELVDRPRPSADLVEVTTELGSKSFPSGHVVYATTFYGLLLFYTYCLDVNPRWALRASQVVLVAMLLGMGLSRVYLGAHWPSDVLGGYAVGGLYVAGVIWWRGTRFSLERVTTRLSLLRSS
ncbi:MAG: phosphatase PAP2 family protein [Dehalococcoidia bacterium]